MFAGEELNFIVANGGEDERLQRLLFGDEPVEFIGPETTMPELLVRCEFFKSKSDARRNGWSPELPQGFFDETIGKLKRRLTIWNPILEPNS